LLLIAIKIHWKFRYIKNVLEPFEGIFLKMTLEYTCLWNAVNYIMLDCGAMYHTVA
jgi:hypothetical protein